MTTSTRTAIVTGASHGIGAAVVQRLSQDGFSVVVNYAGSEGPARELVATLKAAGRQALAVQADVSDSAAMRRLFDEAEQAFGGVDVLVNNAGIIKLAPLAECDDEFFDQVVNVNLKGVFNGMREAARRMRDGGRIISFSSSVVGVYPPNYGVYGATKGAVEALTHILAKELGPRQITVNAIAPGPVATKLFLDGKSDELVAQITKGIPLGRIGQPDEIAGTVSFLAGADGQWVNGQVLRANGGIV